MTIYCQFHFLSQTPLHIAAQQGDMKTVANLVDNGADVHSGDKNGVSETMNTGYFEFQLAQPYSHFVLTSK